MNKAKKLLNFLGENSRYDEMLDLAMSSLAKFKDNVHQVMDFMMSHHGSKLSHADWEKLEDELQEYVDSLEK